MQYAVMRREQTSLEKKICTYSFETYCNKAAKVTYPSLLLFFSRPCSHDHEQQQQHDRFKRDAYEHNWAPGYVAGTSPQFVRFSFNYEENKHNTWVSPTFSNEVFEKEGVHKVFFLIMLLVIIGEFFR